MEIKLISGATTFEAGVNCIKQIDTSDLDLENIVVVPDSFSMQAESLIFDTLGINSTFNIEVVGISRLAGKILRKNNIAYKRTTPLEEVFNIFKAVKMNEDKFLYFKKCDIDFCSKILQIIKQFKACKIKPSFLNEVGDTLLDNKIHDLKLVYESYEQLLQDKLDLSKFLDFFVENAKKCENLSKINLFFVNFDAFSLEINSFICKLAGFVNKIFIGISKPISNGNAFIYENDIFEKTMKLGADFGVRVEAENIPTRLSGERLAMVKNLFSFKIEPQKSDFFLNVVAKNMQDEIEFVVKSIKREVVNGAKFKDFSVACADKKYYDTLMEEFAKYKISAYCDDCISLTQTVLGRAVLKFVEIAKMGFSKEAFEYLVQNPIFEVENRQDVLQKIEYFDINAKKEFLQKFPEFQNIVNQIESLNSCTTISQFCDNLMLLLDFLKDEKILKFLSEEGKFKKESENKQSRELIQKVFEKLKLIGGEEQFNLFDFESLLKLALGSVKVETIPSYIDAVFVGDITESYFEDVKVLFVLGATASALPKTQSDTGLIDDDDIKKLKLLVNIEPEIRVLNRRNRLKLFEALIHAQNRLVVCMPLQEGDRKTERAGFVNDLLKMFEGNVLHTSSLQEFDSPIFTEEETLERLLFSIGCKENLLELYSKLLSERKLKKWLGSLRSVANTNIPKPKQIELASPKQKAKISASELETYFACPFKRFLQYDMRIKTKETLAADKRKFGNFMHQLLHLFVEQNPNVYQLDENFVDQFLKQNLAKIAQEQYDEKLLKQKHFLGYLENEAKIILKNVIKEQKNSDFRPFLLEYRVKEKFEDNLNFEGFADRVDKFGDYFRIIDYKTGETKSVLSDLYYGKKLQLFLYADCIQRATKLKPAGVFYFDCQTKYKKNEGKLLKGVILKSNEIVEAMDTRLKTQNIKSDIIGFHRKNTDENGFSYKWGLACEDFSDNLKYAREISKVAIKEIESGYVKDKPFKDSCEKCQYLSICKHGKEFRDTLIDGEDEE